MRSNPKANPMNTEKVRIGLGLYDQTLIEGIAPITLTQRDLAAYAAAKAQKVQHLPPPAGTLLNQSEPQPVVNQLNLF